MTENKKQKYLENESKAVRAPKAIKTRVGWQSSASKSHRSTLLFRVRFYSYWEEITVCVSSSKNLKESQISVFLVIVINLNFEISCDYEDFRKIRIAPRDTVGNKIGFVIFSS